LVQRIINATPHASIGISPAQLLFGNAVHLDKPLYTSEEVEKSENRSKDYRSYMDNMLSVQAKLIAISQKLQLELDTEHLKKGGGWDKTEFPFNSYVLVRYPHSALGQRPPTKLHSLWRGPLRVVNRLYVTLLKAFRIDEESTDSVAVSKAD
jgi:hypothetical protein